MSKSLSARLAITSGAWTVITLVLTGVILTLLFRAHIERRFDELLQDHLQENIAASEIDANGQLTLSWIPSDPRFTQLRSGWYWAVWRGNEQIAQSRSLWRHQLLVDTPAAGTGTGIQATAGPEGELLRAAVEDITFPSSDDHFAFIVAGPIHDIERDMQEFTRNLALTLATLGVGLLGVVFLQIRFGLRPLHDLQRALAQVRTGESNELPTGYPAEVEPLVEDLNALLAQNALLLNRARTQTGNLAHALKNPLTVIMNEARQLPTDQGDVLCEQATTMKHHIERYLSRARAAGSVSLPGARADVQAIVEDLRFTLDRIYAEKGLSIDVTALKGLYFRGDAGDLEEMMGNVMDNACKWARYHVEVSGHATDGRLILLVDDDGPGIAETARSYAFERGGRLDEQTAGSGLGLSIVHELAELYLGSIRLSSSPNGGMRVRLELPLV